MFTGVTTAMMSGIFDEVKGLIPIVLPTVVAFLAFRKGWSFLLGAVRGA